ncbi:transketolase family protein [Lentzea tibetensis]|uniref:Transketolase family protein n=1 Tax=Lentzea tibetensis TaxID=2591470 RepID=A0A563F1X4_9PSEU|nr:transketolase C-terminal domain-containing protein [Lentzea tibetensis]TWP53802.1 transketolase family protein [Lentzea tibetensis]
MTALADIREGLRFDPATTTAFEACRMAQLDLALEDPRIVSVEADLGDCWGLKFRESLPDRFLDFGIAEASAVGAAAGLAMAGKRPFLNTFGTFALMRAAEQVRLDICYHRAPVVIAGMFTGIAAGFSGPTHHAIEDVSVARALPNLTVIAPADALQAYDATRAALEHNAPVYLRLGVEPGPQVYAGHDRFEIGRGRVLREGGSLTIVTCGVTIVPEVLAAADRLGDVRVVDMPTIKPIDRELLRQSAERTGRVVTVEEHSTIGGLGSAVAEVLAEDAPVPLRMIGLPDAFVKEIGDYAEQLRRHGLDAAGIEREVRAWAY